jgi:hypothetical protein
MKLGATLISLARGKFIFLSLHMGLVYYQRLSLCGKVFALTLSYMWSWMRPQTLIMCGKHHFVEHRSLGGSRHFFPLLTHVALILLSLYMKVSEVFLCTVHSLTSTLPRFVVTHVIDEG